MKSKIALILVSITAVVLIVCACRYGHQLYQLNKPHYAREYSQNIINEFRSLNGVSCSGLSKAMWWDLRMVYGDSTDIDRLGGEEISIKCRETATYAKGIDGNCAFAVYVNGQTYNVHIEGFFSVTNDIQALKDIVSQIESNHKVPVIYKCQVAPGIFQTNWFLLKKIQL